LSVLVTAVVSTFNASRFIRRRLENLISQTLYRQGGLEIIVIDSASRENEAEIVREFVSRYKQIKYLRTERRETVYCSWNRAIELSRGRYFINANTDDLFQANGLEDLADALESRLEYDAVYGDWYYQAGNDLQVTQKPDSKRLYRYPGFYPPLLFYTQPTSHALMIRQEIFTQIGQFNPEFEVFGDREWVFRFAVAGCRALHFSSPVGIYCKRQDSLERSRAETGRREFNGLLTRYSEPEIFVRLHRFDGAGLVTDGKKLSELYARTGELGIHFASISKGRDCLPQQTKLFLRRALALDPDNFSAANNMAVVAALAGQFVFAEKTLRRCFAISEAERKEYQDYNFDALSRRAKCLGDFHWYLSVEQP